MASEGVPHTFFVRVANTGLILKRVNKEWSYDWRGGPDYQCFEKESTKSEREMGNGSGMGDAERPTGDFHERVYHDRIHESIIY